MDEALDRHELIKVKFIEFKEKGEKEAIVAVLEKESGAALVGMIGHVAIFYRQQKDPKKRNIEVPAGKQDASSKQ